MTSQMGDRIAAFVATRVRDTFDAMLEGESRTAFQAESEYQITEIGGMVPFARMLVSVYGQYLQTRVQPMRYTEGLPPKTLSYFLTVPGEVPSGVFYYLTPLGIEWVGSPDDLAAATAAYLDEMHALVVSIERKDHE